MVDLHPEAARAILTDLACGVVLLDDDGRVSWANAYAAQLLEQPVADLLGRAGQELGLPFAFPEEKPGGPPTNVAVCGSLVGITQRYEYGQCSGLLILVLERGHALVGFLTALASGVSGEIAANGLLSRAAIKGRLEAEVSRSRRYSNPLSCVVMHVESRQPAAMSTIARTLKSQLRWVDVLGIWDEHLLLVVLPETSQPAAEALGGKLIQALRAAGHAAPRCGVASWRRGDSAGRLVQRAVSSATAVTSPVLVAGS